MGELPKTPKYFWVYTAHKSIGITVLALVLFRLGWRLYAGAPKPVPGVPSWQERIASATHVLLYVLMFAIPCRAGCTTRPAACARSAGSAWWMCPS